MMARERRWLECPRLRFLGSSASPLAHQFVVITAGSFVGQRLLLLSALKPVVGFKLDGSDVSGPLDGLPV